MIRRQVLVPVPPEEVWEALVDADRSEAWMDGRLALSDLAPGAPLEFRATDGSRWEGAVSIVRPGRYLKFRWWPAPSADPVSEVSYLLEPDGEGATRLTVQEQEREPDEVGGPSASLLGPQRGWTRRDDTGFEAWARAHRPATAFART